MAAIHTAACDALGLNAAQLGEHAARMLLVAKQLGHASPRESLLYLHPSTREAQYLCDLFELSTDELEDKYGDVLAAIDALFAST